MPLPLLSIDYLDLSPIYLSIDLALSISDKWDRFINRFRALIAARSFPAQRPHIAHSIDSRISAKAKISIGKFRSIKEIYWFHDLVGDANQVVVGDPMPAICHFISSSPFVVVIFAFPHHFPSLLFT